MPACSREELTCTRSSSPLWSDADVVGAGTGMLDAASVRHVVELPGETKNGWDGRKTMAAVDGATFVPLRTYQPLGAGRAWRANAPCIASRPALRVTGSSSWRRARRPGVPVELAETETEIDVGCCPGILMAVVRVPEATGTSWSVKSADASGEPGAMRVSQVNDALPQLATPCGLLGPVNSTSGVLASMSAASAVPRTAASASKDRMVGEGQKGDSPQE
ncbi:hypothetical protein EXIGLDRAFT_252885 [Exidia glandulosa HHB12029]|uniref:Uncharacterized protein n=1 Tax=Exidia glandulosa HHB12029 TaxID=1314781 RepID=A0A165MIP5_EXIGL|nr:hypothetical protein EXIGLDRAFT_252885 [Exidia glandulosa HHB12029]